MPLDFPSNPSVNQQYTYGGRTWVWNGAAWDSYNPGITAYVSRLNGFTGGVTLAAGTGITLTGSANVITIATTGGPGGVGATGPTGPQGNTGATGPVGDYVISFNGLTGAVSGVTTSVANTFTALQTFNAGITTSGITLTGPLFLSSGQGITTAVTTFNGLIGAVTGVTTSVANTFTPVQTFAAGINITGNGITYANNSYQSTAFPDYLLFNMGII